MPSVSALRASYVRAFLQCYRAQYEDRIVTEAGYLNKALENLIAGVDFALIESDLQQGDGSELIGSALRPAKFLALHSSTALAANVFGPFKASPTALSTPFGSSFTTLRFERKCPHGIGNGKSPNLDVLLEGGDRVVGIESKLLEPMSRKTAEFRPAYDADLRGGRRNTPWFRQMKKLMANPNRYRWLDAAQLVKHAFGLEFSFPLRDPLLVYLFWEPEDAAQHPIFAEHRAELDRLSAEVAGAKPALAWMSYPDLWRWWEKHRIDLVPHVMRLRRRYAISAAD